MVLYESMSKGFDSIVHDFLISKLEAYGFIYEALNVRKTYLSDKTHRKIIIVAPHFSVY